MTIRQLFLLVLFCPLAAWATSATELAELFMPAEFSTLKLSPDGSYLGLVARIGDRYAIGVYNIAEGQMDLSKGDDKVRPLDFWWKGPRRLLIESSSYKLNALGYTAFDVDGKIAKTCGR